LQHSRSIDLTGQTKAIGPPHIGDFPLRECRVSFRDRQGVEHSVTVTAPSRYHAFGLALHTMKQCSWANKPGGLQKMTIQVLQAGKPLYRRIVLTTEQFEKWLAKDAPSDKAKEYRCAPAEP